jgi:integrase
MGKDEFNFDWMIKKEIKIGSMRIEEPDRTVFLKNIETETPEEFEQLKALIKPSAIKAPPPTSTKRISEYLETFLKITAVNNSPRYVDAIKDAVGNFIEYYGDLPPENITAQNVQQFADSFATWPSNRRKKPAYRNKNIYDILSAPIPEADRISVTTYNNNLQKISSFMIWLYDQKVLKIANPCKRLFKKGKKARDEWSEFTASDVQTILSKDNLIFDKKRPSRYWIPWILAHSGARIEEICGLYSEDVQQVDETDLWYFHIRDDKDDKHLKNDHSSRAIPIHSFLIKLGFLDYVKSIPFGTRLFPDLKYKENFGYHDKISDFFSRYLKRIGVYQPKKSLKSFRHTVITALYRTGASTVIVPEIVGHSPDSSSMSQTRYFKGFMLEPKKEALEKIDWNVSV